MAETLDVLKVVVAGQVTSFRYPHFIQGRHPTFEMPPPATIYGHVCSVVGDWIPPESIRFAYHFTHQGRFTDYEHLHFPDKMAPFNRDLLFNPRLTLYIDRLDLYDAFRSPRYVVVLGRSQDLMTYHPPEIIMLERAEEAYFEGMLLSLRDAAQLGCGFVSVTMPRYVNQYREPDWEQYAVLRESVIYPPQWPEDDEEDYGTPTIQMSERIDFWVDRSAPESPRYPGVPRAVVFHSFRG